MTGLDGDFLEFFASVSSMPRVACLICSCFRLSCFFIVRRLLQLADSADRWMSVSLRMCLYLVMITLASGDESLNTLLAFESLIAYDYVPKQTRDPKV